MSDSNTDRDAACRWHPGDDVAAIPIPYWVWLFLILALGYDLVGWALGS
ncbi:MAG: hypothetical protein OSB00_06365 [Sphingomonas bacterium]|nr:hypothetical protein [Sphingomonas bacterium]